MDPPCKKQTNKSVFYFEERKKEQKIKKQFSTLDDFFRCFLSVCGAGDYR